jgi:uncharacterized membrane protein
LRKATTLLQDYRGKLAKWERIKTLSLALVAAIIILIAMIMGMTSGGYAGPAFLIVLLVIIYLVTQSVMRYISSYYLRISHFLLAVLCRVENNRIYL